MKHKSTSWTPVADWYRLFLEEKNTYQKTLILPNIISRMNIRKNERVLDLACGEGFFSREFHSRGAKVTGVDISEKLITIARQKATGKNTLEFFVSPASRLTFLINESIDHIAIILALQNIENIREVFGACSRVLKKQGKIHIVMTHPAFRIPKHSSWEWDEKRKMRYRRVDSYMTEVKIPIQMHPGAYPNEHTFTFHRPLQYYAQQMKKNNLCITDIEEWVSNKISVQGPRANEENRARKEIPLFIYLKATVCPSRTNGKI